MHSKDRVIMEPIKNQLCGVQSLGDIAGFSRDSWVQSHWCSIPRLEQRSREQSIINVLVSPKGKRKNSWGGLGLQLAGNLLHTDSSL